jgi:hypothetical protein
VSVGAFEENLATFLSGENAWERIEGSKVNGFLTVIPQQGEEFLEPFGGGLGSEDDVPPLLEAVRGAVAVGEPAVYVFEGDAQKSGSGRRVRPLQFVGDERVEGVHGSGVLAAWR